jgi:DNA-binding CsgD family transcriptional regulator
VFVQLGLVAMTESVSPDRMPGLVLPPMQRKVLRLCSLGCTVKEIARILRLSPSTVDNYKTEAMSRVQVRNLAELTRFAIRAEISPISDALTPEEQELRHGPLNSSTMPRRAPTWRRLR